MWSSLFARCEEWCLRYPRYAATGFAVVAAIAALLFLSLRESELIRMSGSIEVLSVARDMRVGEPVSEKDVHRMRISAKLLPRDSITHLRSLFGMSVAVPMLSRTILTRSALVPTAEFGMSGLIPIGMRAVSVLLPPSSGISRLLQPGDMVDVVSIAEAAGSASPVASRVLSNVRVLAVGKKIVRAQRGENNGEHSPQKMGSPTGDGSSSILLEVTPQQAVLLMALQSGSDIQVALRNPTENEKGDVVAASAMEAPGMSGVDWGRKRYREYRGR